MTLFFSGCGLQTPDKSTQRLIQPITLNYWRVWDGPDDFSEIIDAYTAAHPFIQINYRKLRYDEYEQALLEAFATDRGPDIFSIHNSWTRKYQEKSLIAPMPTKVTMAYRTISGNIKKEVVWDLRPSPMPSKDSIKTNFIDAVYDDVVINAIDEADKSNKEQIFGLPLSVDTLSMYYNRDLFNNAGIVAAPAFWNREFQQNVKKLTKQNNKGEIIQAGVALGGGGNVERYSDILALLMMQSGAEMMDGDKVTFYKAPASSAQKNYFPGQEALRFYTDFANPSKEVYSWNKTLENSLDMFINNKLAIMFGYSYMLPEIKARAPKLNFALAPMPQIEGNAYNINFANYWVESVSSKILTNADNLKKGNDYPKQKLNTAWDFIRFATEAKQAKKYLDKTKKTTALRSLIPEQSEDPELGMFAKQLLTAKSWYRGHDANAMEVIFRDMIESIITGQTQISEAINLAAGKIQQTVK